MRWTLREVEAAARERLSPSAFDYAQGGAADEVTLRENVDAFLRWRLRPRFLVDVSKRNPSCTLLGRTYPVPFGVAPTAFHRLFHPEGEAAVARACAQRGMLHVVSTLATTRLEDVAQPGQPRWFQLYVHRDRELTRALVERARTSGYEALVLTVDVPVQGVRERDRRNGFHLPAGMGVANVERLLDDAPQGQDALSHYIATQFDPALTWQDVAWLKQIAPMPVLVKGILTAEDARCALEAGVDGVIVSNHGGRQIDRVPASLDALPEVVEAVGGRVPVLLDGGVRRGSDVLVALARGAQFILLGRQVVWGLAAGGEAGVGRVLDLFREELDNAMALTGRPTLAHVGADLLRPA